MYEGGGVRYKQLLGLFLTDRVLECLDTRVRSGEYVPIGMVGLGGLLALRSSRREVIHADSVH